MGLVELIQQKAFVGREFLTWLWFRAERDGKVDVGEEHGPAQVTVEMLSPLTMEAAFGDARGATLKGDSPATAPEARTALIEGKKLKKARVRIKRGTGDYTATIDGETFAVSGLAVPAAGKMPFEDLVDVRTRELVYFERTIEELFEVFLGLRLDGAAWERELAAVHEWVLGK
jgi:hypothetical protein